MNLLKNYQKKYQKGIFDANLWMHYITQAGILRATYTNVDIVLIDRGIIDSQFYAWKFYKEKNGINRRVSRLSETMLKRS